MAPERIFQGRQRGILGLVGGKDTCNPHLTSSNPGPCNLNSERRLLPCSAPLSQAHDPQQGTPLSPKAVPLLPPQGTRAPATAPDPGTLRGAGSEERLRAASAASSKGRTSPSGRSVRPAPAAGKGRAARGLWLRLDARLPGPERSPKPGAAFLTAVARRCSA